MQTTTATPTATAPATGAADTAGTVTADVTATADTTVAGVGTPTDVAAVLARLTQVTDQLAATIHIHTTNGNDSDSDSDGESGGDGVVRVGMLTAGAILTATDRLTATVVTVLSSLSHRGVIADEGISAEAWLRTFAARTAADERMLSNTVDRLADMPTVRAWFSSGDMSWPVVRGIVAAVRNLTREQRRWVDRTITADPDRTRRLDADEVVAAVQQLADRARPDLHRDRERRAVERDRVYCQDGFDGSSYGSWELGPESAELLRRALFDTNPNHPTTHSPDNDHDSSAGHGHDHAPADTDAHADIRHTGDAAHGHSSDDGDHDSDTDTTDNGDDGHLSDHDANDDGRCPDHDTDHHHDDGDVSDVVGVGDGDAVEVEQDDSGEFTGSDRWRHRREWTNAQALLALCRQRLGEPGGAAPPPARPSMLVIVDIDALTNNHPDGVGSATAQLLTRSTRGPVELTPAAAQRLACDATTRYVLVDGAIPLGATAAEPKVSATLRAALVARDGGCKFPACRQPVDVCDNHHVVPVAKGGPTVLDNLALLCLAHHHAVHDGGWTSRLHPDGTMSFTRRGVTITSLPHRDKRFIPTTPPPTGRATRRHTTRSSSGSGGHTDDSNGGHTDGDLQRDPADTGGVDPDPPPEVAMPF